MRMSDAIWGKISQVFRKIFNNKDLVLLSSTTNNDIDGWNSLSHALLIDALEKEFDISFDIDDILTMNSVEDIYEKISEKMNN